MAVVLNPMVKSGLGEDTFWTWFAREFPGSEFRTARPGDTVLQYSTRGRPVAGAKAIGLLWELYPEMKRALGGNEWDGQIDVIRDCAAHCKVNVVPSDLVGSLYDVETITIPIGVDTDLFRPRHQREIRKKHGIPTDARVGIWTGTTHRMKGYDLIEWDQADYWIVVWKDRMVGRDPPTSHQSYVRVPQPLLAELMSAADFYAVPGRLRPYFLAEYEAMATDLPLVVMGEPNKDFDPPSEPRTDLIRRGWDRKDVKRQWHDLLTSLAAS